ncbi:LLM class flavin-dependent oxidoreductase [Streptomyces purpurogeneiscleroticus]|uniref:LLM class flavin-dependent oxidoreductase n=1 Tax=Streptomyces purpurogeneiscleroticus TaxID=68259 RepID=UPI001CBEE2BE|nr:LLM class flavin-dependent oxidoreductase [Streptomyces purpurogeneiscleroticus]MBZ4019598.1 FMNH2-dependent monooxygenase [Streptomyces purpurogeneiscleroticus]
MSVSQRLPHLAVALDTPDAPGPFDAAHYVRLARLAERGALDFVTLGDTFARPGPDALAVLARVAPHTEHIGLVPTVTTTHTEPFHVATAVQTLDWVSRGRAGWRADVSRTPAEAALFGRRPAAPADALWREAADVADVAGRLWDSWEDDAEIRDAATGRFIDRGKLHYVDFRGTSSTGEPFTVRGPSIVPRPPQGRPVIVVDATEDAARETAAARADVALVRAEDPDTAATVRAELRARAEEWGRVPDRLRVLASLPVELSAPGDAAGLAELLTDWHTTEAADGFHLRPADPERDLAHLVEGTVPVLRRRGLLRRSYPGATLRDHLGLERPVSRYAAVRTGEAS